MNETTDLNNWNPGSTSSSASWWLGGAGQVLDLSDGRREPRGIKAAEGAVGSSKVGERSRGHVGERQLRSRGHRLPPALVEVTNVGERQRSRSRGQACRG